MNLVTQLTGNATWASSLQYRDFRILWSSTLLYSLGSGMEQVDAPISAVDGKAG